MFCYRQPSSSSSTSRSSSCEDSVSSTEGSNNSTSRHNISEDLFEPRIENRSTHLLNHINYNEKLLENSIQQDLTIPVHVERVEQCSTTLVESNPVVEKIGDGVTVKEGIVESVEGTADGEAPHFEAEDHIIKTYTCQLTSKMDVREALVGTNKKFECQVIGFPPPTIRWFKDNVEITHDPRYHFSHTHADGVVSMHIKVIKLSDAGLYQCRAENCEGYAITAAHLQVKGL